MSSGAIWPMSSAFPWLYTSVMPRERGLVKYKTQTTPSPEGNESSVRLEWYAWTKGGLDGSLTIL
jgi:hypothetical protein